MRVGPLDRSDEILCFSLGSLLDINFEIALNLKGLYNVKK